MLRGERGLVIGKVAPHPSVGGWEELLQVGFSSFGPGNSEFPLSAMAAEQRALKAPSRNSASAGR